jgi:hypothetical protein
VLHSYLQAVLCEDDVLLMEFVARGGGDLLDGEVDVVPDEAEDGEEEEEDYEGREFSMGRRIWVNEELGGGSEAIA